VLDFLIGVAVLAALYGVLSISLNLQAGVSGLLDFGLVAFFGIGAYATGIASIHGFSWELAVVIGMAVAAVAGAGTGLLGRTLGAEYWAIATLALAELLRLVVLNTDSVTRGAQGVTTVPAFFANLSPRESDLAWMGVALLVLGICALIAWMITETQFGRILRMVREREDLTGSLGHNVIWAKVRVMAISAPMAALAGSLYTHYITFIGPQELAPFATFLVWTMVVVGGLGSVRGVILGAFAIQLLYEVTRFIDDVIDISPDTAGGIRILVVGAALLGFLFFLPSGLIPERLRSLSAGR
jgi:branched-chain amino acid transport system permease protein